MILKKIALVVALILFNQASGVAQQAQFRKTGAGGIGHFARIATAKVPKVACKVSPSGLGNGIFILNSTYPGQAGNSSAHTVGLPNNQLKQISMTGWAAFAGPSDAPTDFAMGVYRFDPSNGNMQVDTIGLKHLNLKKRGAFVNETVVGTTSDGIQLALTCKSLPHG